MTNPLLRLLVGLAIAILITMVLLLALERGNSTVDQACVDATERELIRANALEGIDHGFDKQVSLLFEIWVKDPHDQPRRAKVGIQNAINAYVRARRDALAWVPPGC